MDLLITEIMQHPHILSDALIEKSVKALPELVENDEFFNVEINKICQIFAKAGIMKKGIAHEIFKKSYNKIGAKAALLLGYINCGELDIKELAEIIGPLAKLPMLQAIANHDESSGIDVDYKYYYDQVSKENKELKDKVLSRMGVTYNIYSLLNALDKPVRTNMYYKSLIIDGNMEPNVVSSTKVDGKNSMAEFVSCIKVQAVSYQITPPTIKDPPKSWRIEINVNDSWLLIDEKNDCDALVKGGKPVMFTLANQTPPFQKLRFIHTGHNRYNDLLAYRNFDINGYAVPPTIKTDASLTIC